MALPLKTYFYLFISLFSIQDLVSFFNGHSLYTNFKTFLSFFSLFFLILKYFIFSLKNKLKSRLSKSFILKLK